MKKSMHLLLLVAFLSVAATLAAQKKYAVLITGDYAKTFPDGTSPWGNGQGNNRDGAIEFWNDTYLMWAMLQEQGFERDNIFVLFADGIDYYVENSWLHGRYRPNHDSITVADGSATIQNVENLFNGLRYGTNGLPKCTVDDFLLVWTFDHGNNLGDHVSLCLLDGDMVDTTFAALVNPISADKKVIWMQQCYSGGFADDFSMPRTVFYAASQADKEARPADNSPYREFELINGTEYSRGEFDFHMTATTSGKTPWNSTSYGPIPLVNADTNDDDVISLQESYLWTRPYIGFNPPFTDVDNISATTGIKYTTILLEDITETTVCKGDIALTKDVTVKSGKTLTIFRNSRLDIGISPNLVVEAGAQLVIEDYVTINASSFGKIIVNGELIVGKNVVFYVGGADTSMVCSNIEICNSAFNLSFDHVAFNNLPIKVNVSHLIINNCTFNNSAVESSGAVFAQISNSTFSNRGLKLAVRSAGGGLNGFTNVVITDNSYIGTSSTAIEINGYEDFNITRNTISGYNNGLQLFNAGSGTANGQLIAGNTIQNCTQAALILYNTSGVVEDNKITDNYCGVKLLNSSNISLEGNKSALDIFHTQLIKDNISHQIFVSQNSFPWYMKFNAIIDDYNTVPLVKYERPGQPNIKVDVTDNFWGVDFNAASDLYIDNGKYTHLPMWQPLNPYYPTELELQYKAANDAFAAGNYAEAKAQYMNIIENNPESVYAEASMKELIRVEPSAKGNLNDLKAYYQTNTVITANENLTVLGDFLANLCDVHMENWQAAIDWYESKIQNPANEQERIFAEIDLGYTYFLMENSANKAAAAVTGRMVEHKYETVKAYNTNRDYLLSLLPGEAASENVKQELRTMETGALLQNYPNPFSQSTTIWYKTDRDAQVQLVVYDMTGKEVARMNEGNKTKGTHSVEFTNSNLSESIYFYTLTLDGQRTDSKKMNVVR